jgi:hypothetical protein
MNQALKGRYAIAAHTPSDGSPFQGSLVRNDPVPGALPRAVMLGPFGAKSGHGLPMGPPATGL